MFQAVAVAWLAVMPTILGDILPEPGTMMVADRRVDIPDLPQRTVAYNPSITEHLGQMYMVFRLDRYDLGWATQMQLGIVQLDGDFRVTRGPSILDTRDVPWANHTSEDPRIFDHNNKMYVVFNATHDGSMDSRRAIRLAEVRAPSALDPNDDFEVMGVSELILNEPGFRPWQEKNWTPFNFDGKVHLIYRTNPPKIYRIEPLDLENMPREIYINKAADSSTPAPFAWGDMRGGTPAFYDASIDKYVSFFHTQTKKDYGGGFKIHYFIGCYTFDPKPPFAITHVLPEPIIVPRMSNPGRPYLEVAYPGGFVVNDDIVHVFYGKNDTSIRALSLDKWQLYDRLKDVQEPQLLQSRQSKK